MGATVITNKAAAGFWRKDGQFFFVLFEETYEKNCYPHTPSWSAIACGTYAEVMPRLMAEASACYEGMLQGRRGWYDPANFVRSWQQVMRSPYGLAQGPRLTLRCGDAWSDHLPAVSRPQWAPILSSAGRTLCDGHLVLDLTSDADCDLLVALCGMGRPVRTFKVFSHDQLDPQVRHEVTLPENKSPVVAHAYEALRLPSSRAYFRVPGEPFRTKLTVVTFIFEQALAMELSKPGSSLPAIRRMMDLEKEAAPFPGDTRIRVLPPPEGAAQYLVEHYRRLAERLPAGEGTLDAFGTDSQSIYELGSYPHVEFQLPERVPVA